MSRQLSFSPNVSCCCCLLQLYVMERVVTFSSDKTSTHTDAHTRWQVYYTSRPHFHTCTQSTWYTVCTDVIPVRMCHHTMFPLQQWMDQWFWECVGVCLCAHVCVDVCACAYGGVCLPLFLFLLQHVFIVCIRD